MKRLIILLSNHRRPLFVGILFLVLANIFALAIPWVMKEAIDALKGPPSWPIFHSALLLVLLAALQGLFRFLGRWTLIGAAREIEYELRNQLFRHLLTLPPSFYQRMRTGDLMARATQDVNTIRMLLGAGIMYLANTLLVYGTSVALMLSIDPLLTFFALLPYPLLFLAMKKVRRGIHDRFEEVQRSFARLCDKAQENLSGIRVVKASSLEPEEIKSFTRFNEDYVRKNLRLARVESLSQPLAGLAGGLGMMVILWLGGRKVIEGSLTLGGLVAFNAYLAMLLWPTLALAWIANLFERGRVSMERIEALLKEEPTRDRERTGAGEVLNGDIEFRHLTFASPHDGRRPILEGIELKIPKGTKVALVGPTGSGKSTLLALIPRLLEVPKGCLFIDGIDVTSLPLAILRQFIGYVPQETFLFSATIRENIAFGLPSPQPPNPNPHPRLEWAAQIADLLKDLETLPQGWETVVGERGVTLSGGQRQRVALARALARDPQILILDDALSSVDAETEDRIMKGLLSALKDRTILIATHRLSAVKGVDLIVVLDEGRIVEVGRHQELLQKGGLYRDLWQKQQLRQELERI